MRLDIALRGLFLIVLFLVVITPSASATTQTKFVGSCSSDSSSGGTQSWTSTGNAYANDESDTTTNAKFKNGEDSERLLCDMTGNQFTIPTDATVNGIAVKVEAEDTLDGGCEDLDIRLVKAGTLSGNNNDRGASRWSQTEEIITWGSSTDLWGLSWNSTYINAANFGVGIRVEGPVNIFCQPSIDYVEIVVNYTVADTTPPASVTNLANQSAGTTWIYWNWTNPVDSDFNHTVVYLDGVWKQNSSNNYYNATGLSSGTSYTITVHTVDTNGNVNNTDANSTAFTLVDSTISSCTVISSPGTYVLTNDILDDGNTTCINITSSKVIFICSVFIKGAILIG